MTPALARASRGAAPAGLGPFAWVAVAAVALLFLISAMALTHWGLNYEATGGNIVEKVHPGTWLAFAAFAGAAARYGNPVAFSVDALGRRPGAAALLAAWAYLLGHIVLAQKAPFTPIIDTFLLPIVLMLLLDRLDERPRRALALALHAVFFVNAALGLFEFRTGYRLTPYVAGSILIEADWRATALFGHPLGNASLTAVYALALCLGGGRDLPPALRAPQLLLQVAAMFAFGGRASLLIMAGLMAAIALVAAGRFLGGGRLSILAVGIACIAAPIAAVALEQMYQSGFFDQMVERFVDDKGSAKARVAMLRLFGYLNWDELLIGPDPEKIQSLQNLEGVEFGIESFFVGYVLSYGLIVSLMFFAGLALFCVDLVRASRPATVALLVFFFTVAATSVSLSAKTCLFGMFVALVMTLLRRTPEAAATDPP